MFEDKYGDAAHDEITERTQQAFNGIPKTLAEIKRIAESIAPAEDAQPSPTQPRD